MVAPALSQLRRLVDNADSDSVKLTAIRDILDRAGYKLPDRVESDNAVTIRVEYETLEQVPARVIEHHYESLQNGATNGQSKTND